MKFEKNPKRCYMCQTIFSNTVKPIPVIGGSSAAGYVCSTCYVKLFGASKRGKNNETKLDRPIQSKPCKTRMGGQLQGN